MFRVKDRVLQYRASAEVVQRCPMLSARTSAALTCQTGLTMLEVLISMLVVGLAISGLALAFSSGTVWVREIGTDRVGIELAEQQIESIRNCGIQTTGPNGWVEYQESQIPAIGAYAGCLPPGASAPCNGAVPCFNRVTKIENVDPAALDQPAPTACPNGQHLAADPQAQRITVTVTAVTSADGAAALPQASTLPIMLQGWFQTGLPACS